jgi:CheY-like chemotaxis protein
VVEDNQEALFIYERYLRETQFQIMPARDLDEARKALRAFRPTAVILDVLLQGEHSWELLQELKREPNTSTIPVFVITVVENREKATALGADAFHSKPVDRLWLTEHLQDAANRATAKHVLIIDDDEVSRYVVRTTLGHSAFRYTEATGGQEGVRRARETKPEIIILDLAMPDLSGFEVLKRLKQDSETTGVPVIVHTSKVLLPEEEEMLRDAIAIISKGGSSREALLDDFAKAFGKAQIPFRPRTITEEQHV